METFKRLMLGLLLVSLASVSWGEEMTFFCEVNKQITVNKESNHFVSEDKRKFKLSVSEADVVVTWPNGVKNPNYKIRRFNFKEGEYLFLEAAQYSNRLISLDHDYSSETFAVVQVEVQGTFGHMHQSTCTKF